MKQQNDQFNQYITESLASTTKLSNIRLKDTKQGTLVNRTVILLLVIITILSILLIQIMSKVNKMNRELESVSSNVNFTLTTLSQVKENLGIIASQNLAIIGATGSGRVPKFFNFRMRDLHYNEQKGNDAGIMYQASVNGDKLVNINNNQPFHGRVTIIMASDDDDDEKSLTGVITQLDYSLSIIVEDNMEQSTLYVNLKDGFLSQGTMVNYITKESLKNSKTIQIKDLIVYYVN